MTEGISAEQAKFMGKVAEWLNTAPESRLQWGEFYISKVVLAFDGEKLGHAVLNEDDSWVFHVGRGGEA